MSQAGGPLPAIPKIGTQGGERRQTVVLHPYSGSARKNWPYERFLELERWYPVEWAAGPAWVRFDDLMELAQWIAGAALYVGNDSGITHLAAAVGTPVVALFGPTDPEVWGPRGMRVKVVRARSMDEISTATVRAVIDGLLAGG
jgi:ADP-heptose:LPS heptosyltransferase